MLFMIYVSFYKKIFILILERERKGYIYIYIDFREREKNINRLPPIHTLTMEQPTTWVRALTGNQTRDVSVYRAMHNQLSHAGQSSFTSF